MQDFQSFKQELIQYLIEKVATLRTSESNKNNLATKIKEMRSCSSFQELAKKAEGVLGKR